MGDVVKTVSDATGLNLGNTANSAPLTQFLNHNFRANFGNDLNDAVNSGGVDIGGAFANKYTGGTANPFEAGGTVSNFLKGPDRPDAPGINQNLQDVKARQLQNAQNFRANLPNFEAQMMNQVKRSAYGGLNQDLQGIRSSNSSRGLLYGGIDQAQEGNARANTAGNLMGERSRINTQAERAANSLDAQAIQTGLGIQSTQQDIQDGIYAQAMTDMAMQGQVTKGFMGMIGGGAARGFLGNSATTKAMAG